MSPKPKTTLTPVSLRNAYEVLRDAVLKWQGDDQAPVVNGRKAFTEELQTAFETAINETADCVPVQAGEMLARKVEPAAYDLALAWDKVAEAYRDYKMQCAAAISVEELDPAGTTDLWRAFDALAVVIASRANYAPPAPILTLQKHGATDDQIARTYGWFTADTEHLEGAERVPDVNKVYEELEKPGTHYQAEKWVHPALAARLKAVSAQWASRQPRSAEYVDPSTYGKTAPPSLDELVALGAPPAQISRLHSISEDDAAALLLQAGKEVLGNASDVRVPLTPVELQQR